MGGHRGSGQCVPPQRGCDGVAWGALAGPGKIRRGRNCFSKEHQREVVGAFEETDEDSTVFTVQHTFTFFFTTVFTVQQTFTFLLQPT